MSSTSPNRGEIKRGAYENISIRQLRQLYLQSGSLP